MGNVSGGHLKRNGQSVATRISQKPDISKFGSRIRLGYDSFQKSQISFYITMFCGEVWRGTIKRNTASWRDPCRQTRIVEITRTKHPLTSYRKSEKPEHPGCLTCFCDFVANFIIVVWKYV